MDPITAWLVLAIIASFTGLLALALLLKKSVKGRLRILGSDLSFEADDRRR